MSGKLQREHRPSCGSRPFKGKALGSCTYKLKAPLRQRLLEPVRGGQVLEVVAVHRAALAAVAARRAARRAARIEHERLRRALRRELRQVPRDGGARDAGADDDRVGLRRQRARDVLERRVVEPPRRRRVRHRPRATSTTVARSTSAPTGWSSATSVPTGSISAPPPARSAQRRQCQRREHSDAAHVPPQRMKLRPCVLPRPPGRSDD